MTHHTVRRLTVAVAALFALSFIVLGSIFLARWWSNAGHADVAMPVAVPVVPARILRFRLSDLTYFPSFIDARGVGVLRVNATVVGRAYGYCTGTTVSGTYICTTAFEFTGAGGIAAGTIIATDIEAFAAYYPFALLGGTGAYATAAGESTAAVPDDDPAALEYVFNITSIV